MCLLLVSCVVAVASASSFIPSLDLTLGTTFLSVPLPPDYVGLSFEWQSAEQITNHSLFPKLMRYLTINSISKKGPNIRVGGNSADETWWNPDGTKDKNSTCNASYSGKFCITNDMKVSTLQAIKKGVSEMNGSVVIDLVMLQNNSATWAVEEAQAVTENIGWDWVESFEIGNENDLFPQNGARSPSYNSTEYEKEFNMYVSALTASFQIQPRKFIQGGTFCCEKNFDTYQSQMLSQWSAFLKSWSFHRYPTTTCSGQNVTVQALLSDDASDKQANMVRGWVQQAQQLGVPFNIGESNSASCGGQKGVSNTLAAALWSLDYLFAMAAVNVSRVNFHGGGSGPYSWFNLPSAGSPQVFPLFYGMSLFSWAAANSSRVVELKGAPEPLCQGGIEAGEVCCAGSCGACGGTGCDKLPGGAAKCCSGTIVQNNLTCVQPSDDGCVIGLRAKAWALTDSESRSRVVVINKNLNSATNVRLNAPGSRAQMVVLSAQFINSSTGLSFAGLTWDNSKSGELVGTFDPTILSAVDSAFSFQVAPASAAIIFLGDSQPPA